MQTFGEQGELYFFGLCCSLLENKLVTFFAPSEQYIKEVIFSKADVLLFFSEGIFKDLRTKRENV